MMSFVWGNSEELHLLESFLEEVTIENTKNNNDKKHPSLIAGGKDSNDKMFLFFRVFMPNFGCFD